MKSINDLKNLNRTTLQIHKMNAQSLLPEWTALSYGKLDFTLTLMLLRPIGVVSGGKIMARISCVKMDDGKFDVDDK